MTTLLYPVEPIQFDEEVLNCPKAVVVIYWNSRDVDHSKLVEQVETLARQYLEQVKVLTIDDDVLENRRWFNKFGRPYDLRYAPCLLVFKTPEERQGLVAPGIVERANFRPALKAMFHYASRP